MAIFVDVFCSLVYIYIVLNIAPNVLITHLMDIFQLLGQRTNWADLCTLPKMMRRLFFRSFSNNLYQLLHFCDSFCFTQLLTAPVINLLFSSPKNVNRP